MGTNKVILVFVVISALVVNIFNVFDKSFHIYFLNVGQGDSTFIRSSENFTALIDGGSDSAVISQVGKYLSTPFIELDLLVLTHPHADHINGLNLIIERFNPKLIIYNSVKYEYAGYESFTNLCAEKVKCIDYSNNSYVSFKPEESFEIEFFTPNCGRQARNINNCSIITQVRYKKQIFLLMGDAEIEEEEWFLDNYGENLDTADILKAGHHCSRTASSKELLELVAPRIVICSCGKENKFGHPHKEAIERFEEIGAEVFMTWDGLCACVKTPAT
jgi:competence protein ComEC